MTDGVVFAVRMRVVVEDDGDGAQWCGRVGRFVSALLTYAAYGLIAPGVLDPWGACVRGCGD
jgi:hypothetical protein